MGRFVRWSMGNILNSSQLHSIWPFNRDAIPVFLRTNPKKIKNFSEKSKCFLSLVDFVKEGNQLDNRATKQACALLDRITPIFSITFLTDQVLFKLVPTPDDSCSGFAESIVPLLASSNEQLVTSTLSLLNKVVLHDFPVKAFLFLETGFFQLLPPAFFEQARHLSPSPKLFLMKIVAEYILLSQPSYTQYVCQERQISATAFQLTFIDKFVRPIQPFLAFVCRNRRRINDSEDSRDFSCLLGSVIRRSPFLEEFTQFVLSSQIAQTCTDCLVFFEVDLFAVRVLRGTCGGPIAWQRECPAVQKRGQQVLRQLRAEGLSDESELHIRCRDYDDSIRSDFFLGAMAIDHSGGNVRSLSD
ncbi:hypothetical protein BLNAU_7104 [Blattamonas nauphoetae]|uniref:Uncharacterized protein n=1 Tax=Blattamonas nauphoetae TaxID=2049346 RepID=A0ABQ9Y2F8_9EUKA|nr:hypothetical protein BLNAU_7104 [Blattamonas nauphoetae]